MRRSLPAALVAAAVSVASTGTPLRAFDDAEFCIAAKEFVRSVAGDVGTWTDRLTRNDGVDIGCEDGEICERVFTVDTDPVAGFPPHDVGSGRL